MNTLKENIPTTTEKRFQWTLFALRASLGVVVLGHGVQKLFGWFNGYGFEGTMGFFTGTIGLPYAAGVLIIAAETLGMVLLIGGLFGRYIAAVLIVIMIGAIVTTHGAYGFFMNWDGTSGGEGYEFHLLVIALSVAIVLNGTGACSLDRYILARFRPQKQTYFI